MSKRGDKRRAKGKRRGERRIAVETFELGPLALELHGTSIVSKLDPEHPEFDEFVRWREQVAAGWPERLAALRDELRELFAPLDAFDVVTGLFLANVPKDPETYRESTESGVLAVCEIAAAILIERSGREGTAPDAATAPTLSDAQEKLLDYLRIQSFLYYDEARRSDPDDSEFAEIRALARSHRLGVRGSSYEWQETRTLLELLDDEALRATVASTTGFSAPEALALADATVQVGLSHLAERIEAARAGANKLLAKDARTRTSRGSAKETEGIVGKLATMRRSDAVKQVQRLAVQWAGLQTGTTMQFTSDELARFAGVSEAATEAFLGRFSVAFGEFEVLDRPPNLEDFRDRPLLDDGTGNYICISPPNLHWALRAGFENALKDAGDAPFARYERHRSSVAERRAVEALAGSLRADWAHSGLHYEITEDGQLKRPELDGLVRHDSALFIVEVKAAGMRPSARRGAPDALRDWLRDELAKAGRQVRRTRDALLAESGPPPLFDSKGRSVSLDLTGIHHVVEVVVLLEDLPAIAPQTWRLADAGLLPRAPVPWTVSLHELEVICEVVSRPLELVHYAQRRQRLDEHRRAWAVDELDYFMHYILSGLYWPAPEDGEDVAPVHLLSHTDKLDAYMMFKHGKRTRRAKRPAPKHHRKVAALLDCLDELDSPGRLDVGLVILDSDQPSRRRIAADLSSLRAISAKDGMPHDRSFFFGQEYGVTIMTVPPSERTELLPMLQSYCLLKKHQARADKWIGFGGFAGPREPFQHAVILLDPWKPDEELDELVATMPSAGFEGKVFDGRKLTQQNR
jgi:hypothetical protein